MYLNAPRMYLFPLYLPSISHLKKMNKRQHFKVAGEDRSATNGKWLNPVVQK